jgi:hypothetical protein
MGRQSRGALAGGIVAVSVGGVLTLAGGIAAMIPAGCTSDGTCSNHLGPALGLAVGGLVGLAVGIPLIVYGAKKVPAGAALSSPLPAWAGAPGGRGWVWRF